MDPDKALADIIDAAVRGDGPAVRTRADNLSGWLARGGFAPSDPRKTATAKALREVDQAVDHAALRAGLEEL